MQWLSENWADIVTVLAAFHVFAAVVVNVTPTPKDDELVSKVYRWIEIFGGIVTSLAKETKDDKGKASV